MNLGSSPEAEVEIDPIEIDSKPDAAADSSPVDKGAEKSLIESVQDALKDTEGSPASKKQDSATPAAPQSDAKPDDPAKADDEPLPEVTEDELKRYGPKTQRRIRQLLSQRHESEEKFKALQPKAAEFDKLDTFVRNNQLSGEDVATTFEIAALVRNDPFKAWEKLTPIVARLAEMTGHILPDDLQEKVRLGYITKEDAVALAQSRSKSSFYEKRTVEQTEQQKQDAERASQARHVEDCRVTANDWEAAKRGSDPDFNLKAARITEKLKLKLHENRGFPTTKQDVNKWLDDIYADVTKELRAVLPKPKPVVSSVNTGGASPSAKAEPTSALEAAKRALAG